MRNQRTDFVLDEVYRFVSTMFWGPEEYRRALTLLLAVSHVKDAFSAVPHVLMTSDRPGTGKTTATKNIPLMLASRPWVVGRTTTEYALMNKFLDRNTSPDSILADDVSKSFTESGTGGRGSKLYQLLVDCYLSNAKVSMSVNRVSTDVPAYAMAWMNGLNNAVPADLASRAIEFRLKPKPRKVKLQDALSPGVQAEGEILREALHSWARSNTAQLRKFMQSGALRVHPLLTDRTLQKWGPLFALADAAGGAWPGACMDAFQLLGLDASEKTPVLPFQQVLLDTAKIVMDAGVDRVFTADLVAALRERPEEFYQQADDRYLVEQLLPRALGPVREMRGRSLDGTVVQGAGRMAAPILRAAAELHEQLFPEPEETGPDAVQRELTLTVVTR
jgi:hypothetical protein